MTTATTPTAPLNLAALVHLAASNPNAVEMLHERQRQAEERGDWRAVQMIGLAIRHATKRAEG